MLVWLVVAFSFDGTGTIGGATMLVLASLILADGAWRRRTWPHRQAKATVHQGRFRAGNVTESPSPRPTATPERPGGPR